ATTQSKFSADGVLGGGTKTNMAQITDGTSKTFLVGEVAWSMGGVTPVFYRAWDRGCGTGSYGCSGVKNVYYSLNNPASNTTADADPGFDDVAFGSMHPGGANFLLCDASVRGVTETTSLDVLFAVASRGDGETATAD